MLLNKLSKQSFKDGLLSFKKRVTFSKSEFKTTVSFYQNPKKLFKPFPILNLAFKVSNILGYHGDSCGMLECFILCQFLTATLHVNYKKP